jgi:two-component system, cell cycle sensor histidine kinase DivJ
MPETVAIWRLPGRRAMFGSAKTETAGTAAPASDSNAAFERSRLIALFVSALLVPALLVLDGPRDWRLALLASTPSIPAMLALITARSFGVDAALAVQFGAGAFFATVAAATGFGFAVPALIVALMVIDALLISPRVAGSPVIGASIGSLGIGLIVMGAASGGFAPQADFGGTLIWLVIPSLVQIGTAIVVWRKSNAWRRKTDNDPSGILHRSVDRAQREVGVLLDAHGRADDVTGNVRDVMGLRAADAMGRGLVERLHLLDRPGFLKAVAEAASDSLSCVLRLRFTRLDIPDGDRTFRWFEGRVFPVTGSVGSALMMIRDIDDEMVVLTADTERRKKAQEERNRRARFLADLSHDVRTPLNAIIGFAELLSNPSTQPREAARITEYANIVHRSGRDLLEVVTMLVEMTRVENGAFEFVEEAAKPAILLEQLRDTLAEAVERPDLALKTAIAEDACEWLVDRRAVRQVLFGIASTLIDQSGAVDLSVEVTCQDQSIRFAFRASPAESGRLAGRRSVTAGLSMEVAMALAAIMGGSITIEEIEGAHGASLCLPMGGRVESSDHSEKTVDLAEKRAERDEARPQPAIFISSEARRSHG